jgi:RHS repeat-associated protein
VVKAQKPKSIVHELTNWNGTPISYDLNGNMLSDGSNAFTWNARDQVATLNNVSVQYDAAGRRIQNAAGKSLLFDEDSAAQELSGSTATANVISGGIDEIFTRADSAGAYTPLQDALGSTIALVDGSGNLVTQYAYDPFGNTSVSGATNSNAFQYTGRENEGNGLYFYRARYYSPLLGRFINEDPTGFAGGLNLYVYVGDSPTILADPFGLRPGDKYSSVIAAAAAALGDVANTSMCGHYELGGVLYQMPDGTFSYTKPFEVFANTPWSPGTSSDEPVPPGDKGAGEYHTHPIIPGRNAWAVSDGDKINALHKGQDIYKNPAYAAYILFPNGDIHQWLPNYKHPFSPKGNSDVINGTENVVLTLTRLHGRYNGCDKSATK